LCFDLRVQPEVKNRTFKVTLIAAFAALASTTLGIGGGVLMVPLLTLVVRMPIKQAAGTSLAMVVGVIAVGLIAQEIKAPGDIHWDVALLLAVFAIGGTFVGNWLNRIVPEAVLRYAFCLVLIVAAVRLIGIMPDAEALLRNNPRLTHPGEFAFLAIVGVVAGVTGSLFGVGGGIVVVPALALAYGYFNTHFAETRATSLAVIMPTSIVGAWLHWRAKNVELPLVLRTLPVAVVFSAVGVLVAYAVNAEVLKVAFALLLLAAALRLALQKSAGRKTPSVKAPEAAVTSAQVASNDSEKS
jgi:uncharacterized membrane protein YfcA